MTSKNCGRCYEFIISKAESAAEYWPSLTTDKKKPHWLKVDFNKWKDEGSDDDSDAAPGGMDGGMAGMAGMGGMGGGMGGMADLMSSMGGMGGMGGFGGADGDGRPNFDDLEGEEDSDDEAIPDLETASEQKK